MLINKIFNFIIINKIEHFIGYILLVILLVILIKLNLT